METAYTFRPLVIMGRQPRPLFDSIAGQIYSSSVVKLFMTVGLTVAMRSTAQPQRIATSIMSNSTNPAPLIPPHGTTHLEDKSKHNSPFGSARTTLFLPCSPMTIASAVRRLFRSAQQPETLGLVPGTIKTAMHYGSLKGTFK